MHELMYAYFLLFCSSIRDEKMAVNMAFIIFEVFQRKSVFILYVSLYSCNKKEGLIQSLVLLIMWAD